MPKEYGGFVGKIIIVVFALFLVAYGVSNALSSLSTNSGYVAATQATGTLVFSGNVSNGELVNITSGTAVYLFEFNTTSHDTPTLCQTVNCISINLTKATGGTWNQSVYVSGNLTAAINVNASTAALVTAVNTTNRTTLTAVNPGIAGNSITITTNAANIIASGMSGAANGYGFSTSSPITPLLIFVAILVVIGIAWTLYNYMKVK